MLKNRTNQPLPKLSTELPRADWTYTRTVYKKLSSEFKNLIAPFGIAVDLDTRLRMDHLLIAIDYIDRILDPIDRYSERLELCDFLLKSLDGTKHLKSPIHSDDLLRLIINNLSNSITSIPERDRFILAVGQIFKFTEEKRHTSDSEELIQLIFQEGKATAELPLAIMNIDPDHPFALFFSKLCMLMGLADLIVDLRSDFKSGFIKVKPSLTLYLKLIKLVTAGGYKLMTQLPSKTRFITYCLRMTWSLLWSRD